MTKKLGYKPRHFGGVYPPKGSVHRLLGRLYLYFPNKLPEYIVLRSIRKLAIFRKFLIFFIRTSNS